MSTPDSAPPADDYADSARDASRRALEAETRAREAQLAAQKAQIEAREARRLAQIAQARARVAEARREGLLPPAPAPAAGAPAAPILDGTARFATAPDADGEDPVATLQALAAQDALERKRQMSMPNAVFIVVGLLAIPLADLAIGFPVFTVIAAVFAGLFAIVGLQWLLWRTFFPGLLAEAGAGRAAPLATAPLRAPDSTMDGVESAFPAEDVPTA